MAKSVAIIEFPQQMTKKQVKELRKAAEKRLVGDFLVLVITGGGTVKIVPGFGK